MLKSKSHSGQILENHPLWRHNTWHVGGSARRLYRPSSLNDLANFLSQTPTEEPILWLGLGSNVLIRDKGFAGTVIVTRYGLRQIALAEKNTVRAEAGVTCAKLAKFCAQHGFEAGTFFAGIPGTVGGALAMNAGAFGGETWRCVKAVETIDAHGQQRLRYPSDYKISYRSVERSAGEWFTAGYFEFTKVSSVIAQQAIRDLLHKRAQTQPIGTFNCGSVFRNPTGYYAAQLIETAGLKGYRLGGAVVSNKHANFIINDQNALSSDIEALINTIIERVYEVYSVRLLPEVHIVGEA